MDSLPACARTHPGRVSRVVLTHAVSNRGKPFTRRVCVLCKSIGAKSQPHNGNTFVERVVVQREKYGVVALCWTPPELQLTTLELPLRIRLDQVTA